MSHKYVIIDPFSVEQVRSSFCYLPYLVYAALKTENQDVVIIEDFTEKDIANLPEADHYIVGLWSYPQIEMCLKINTLLKEKVLFAGYSPLILSLNLKELESLDKYIETGLQYVVLYYQDFKNLLLSDSDMHTNKYGGLVYPLFTSYGCTNKCKFCPVAANCKGERQAIPLNMVFSILDYCEEKGYKNIHFMDEDFFYDIDRSAVILEYTKGKGFQYISLGTAGRVLEFVKAYGAQYLKDRDMKVIEIGLESADQDLNKQMGKVARGGRNRYETLAEMAKGYFDIFWLTMTFFPGETISSLRQTGKFLEKYGYKYGEMYKRIQTNSSVGGLGQFFQFYEGTEGDKFRDEGMILAHSPHRLEPSFVPDSFLDSLVTKSRPITEAEKAWYRLYDLPEAMIETKFKIENLESIFLLAVDLKKKFLDLKAKDIFTFLAISARLGVIE